MLMPPVKRYMTLAPWTVAPTDVMSVAHQLMREHGIRHLPVVDHGHLVGVVSDRDLHLVESLRDVDPGRVPIEDAMTEEVLEVGPDAPLDEVVAAMEERKCGSAVVSTHGVVAGIFTTIDALHALDDVLARAAG